MSKAVSKGMHWMPRTSQYSLHGQRNGRVDVLPPTAKMSSYYELRDRYNRYKAEYRAALDHYQAEVAILKADRQFLKKHRTMDRALVPSSVARQLDRVQHAADTMGSLNAKLSDMKKIFFEEQNVRYERAWIETARAMLPWDVVDQIEHVVQENLRNSLGE